MDGLSLLDKARTAGLTVQVVGDRLIVRGPRHAETLALELLAHKSEVLAALKSPPDQLPAAIIHEDDPDLQHEAARVHHHPAVLLLSQMVNGGFTVRANGDRLFITPRALLTAAQCRAIARYKLDLLALVKEVDGICELLDRMARPLASKPLAAELVSEWLETAPDVTLTEWLEQKKGKTK